MRKIVLDIETQNTFQDVGSNSASDLDISLLVIYDYKDGKYKTFMEKDFSELWKILEQTDLIVGYNSDHFDIPLLNKYYSGDLSQIKSLDLLVPIRESLGRRVRLDSVASGTLGKNKSGDGLQAIRWWKNGEIEKIEKYCKQDVKVTKEIYEYAMKHKKLKYKEIGQIIEFDIDTAGWDEGSVGGMNYTLPF